uniref:Glycoprotein-N-acetylgalactosamine 3-beta-galactosyltransferase 1-like n=1 Tax=Nicotiana tabacum TaxID=4097 RepID=A0A1S3ZH05_TOBAC
MKEMSLRKRYVPFPNNHKLVPKLCTIFIIKSFLITFCLVASIYLISNAHLFKKYAYDTAAVTNKQENISKEEEETNISHILFGIGGSTKSWNNRSSYSELWWRPNVTRGFVWLDEIPQENEPWPETFPPYRVSEDTSTFKYTCWFGDRSAVRIARILKESFELGLNNVRWFVMGDDDTVFFTENLVTVLTKYDHNQMYYIGGISESVEINVLGSYSQAFGGGGIAISYPLAAELVKILDGCINRYHYLYASDQKIGSCVTEIGVSLTKEPGFHQ